MDVGVEMVVIIAVHVIVDAGRVPGLPTIK
jgi:hypothetical protein